MVILGYTGVIYALESVSDWVLLNTGNCIWGEVTLDVLLRQSL